jgi:signal transduction histidine kinase
MRRSRRIAWWTAYGLGAAAVVAGLGWTSVRVIWLEREERTARIAAERQETMRAALWRLDFWLAPRLARESARTWFDYEPYHPQTIAYNRLLEPIAEGEVLLPSPLLTFNSRYLTSHFQWRQSTGFTSPQIPGEELLALETVGCAPVPSDPIRRAKFQLDVNGISATDLERRLREHELALERTLGDNAAWTTATSEPVRPAQVMSQQAGQRGARSIEPAQDYRARQSVSNDVQEALQTEAIESKLSRKGGVPASQDQRNVKGVLSPPPGANATPAPATPVEVGAMVPVWLPGASLRLVLARRVRFESETILQGVLVDWEALRTALLEEIESIAPGADLAPVDALAGDDSRRLASLPVVLTLAPDEASSGLPLSQHPAALGLLLVWCAAFGAIGATGLALRSSIANAVRTSRFASSVTHELRTPLTTFRLYAEMLADGVVTDEPRRQQYFATLRDESARLGLLVENVLAWSRAEDGRTPRELRATNVGAVLAAVVPLVQPRCAESGLIFESATSADAELPLHTDPARVSQILFHFVDNACKYAGAGATLRLAAARAGDWVRFSVDDSGPGVPDRLRARVFRAFDRGDRGPGDAVRGLGLGLAIATELTSALGGRLRCERSELGGASFVLELPLAKV